ncbi:hypothetical protein [Flavihumibacter sp. ZG627]|uniref:hypothetical protein n=1 Tax=Flavihumibacter sp. ZG627 TaxID=1463156 RepID=UPI0012E00950|nr:hypothetical protein [Flavihumibacter sp. ZG627]
MNALLEAEDKKRRRLFFWWWIPVLVGIALGGYFYRTGIPTPLKDSTDIKSYTKIHSDKLKTDPETTEISGIEKRKMNVDSVIQPEQAESPINGTEYKQANAILEPKINDGKKFGISNRTNTDITFQQAGKRNPGEIDHRAITEATDNIQLRHTQFNNEFSTIISSSVTLYTPFSKKSSIEYPEKINGGPGINIFSQKTDKTKQAPQKAFPFYLFGSIAPEVSGVNGKGKLRFGMGMGIGMKLSRSMFIQAGVINTNKVYSADGSNYYPKPGSYYDNENLKIQYVEADCNIIEIPLQIGMNIIQRKRNTIFIMAGITASIMQKEFYKYQYTRYGVPAESEYTYRTKSFDPVTGAGISVGYQRKINSRLVLQLNPYYNFPLNGIGEGRVEISSAGLQAGLRYNFDLFK